MQTQKMSLANLKGKLSRVEMKKIMAGSDSLVLCSGSGNYGLICNCGGQPFYCCNNSLSTCISANGCPSSGYACARA